jgi:hypothetical protein
VLFVILCGVWFCVLSRCLFSSYWKINISQLQIQPMIWASTLQIQKHEYFGDLGFIILFVGILPSYAINLGVVSLFADSSFTFLTMFVSDVLYRFEWMNIVLFLSKKKKPCPLKLKQHMNFHSILMYYFLNRKSNEKLYYFLNRKSIQHNITFELRNIYWC